MTVGLMWLNDESIKPGRILAEEIDWLKGHLNVLFIHEFENKNVNSLMDKKRHKT